MIPSLRSLRLFGMPKPMGVWLVVLASIAGEVSGAGFAGWSTASAQGGRSALIHAVGHSASSVRLDFDFPNDMGYVTLRKDLVLSLPENYALSFNLRGDAPPLNIEFKLLDGSGESVWWYRWFGRKLPEEWQPQRIKKRLFEFAWGPAAGAPLKRISAVELTISSLFGGKGSIWLDDLRFEPLPPDRPFSATPKLQASSTLAGTSPNALLDDAPASPWHSRGPQDRQWLQIDFRTNREYGGLVIDWDDQDYACRYQVLASKDARRWRPIYRVAAKHGLRDHLYLPDGESRYLRLEIEQSNRGQGVGIRRIQVKPHDFSATPNRFFESIALDAPRGAYPRYFHGEQSDFTVVGADGGEIREGLFNTDGMLEVDRGAFSIEPFVYADGRLLSWSDVDPQPALEQGYLPIPSTTWRYDGLSLKVTAFASEPAAASVLYGRYRIENTDTQPRNASLFLAIRPFQVNPPWQSLNLEGGVAAIHTIRQDAQGGVRVNGERLIQPLTPPHGFGAATFDEGSITEFLAASELPKAKAINDRLGFGSGAFRYDLSLAPGSSKEIFLAIPMHDAERSAQGSDFGRSKFEAAKAHWQSRLAAIDIRVPASAGKVIDSLRSQLGFILINRDGAALQPGSRTYARTWIRDGTMIASALLSMGYAEEVRQFIRWYAGFQFADGKIPCCVDWRGADSVPENDSHGEFIYAVAEYYRYTRDAGLVSEMWPHIVKAVDYIRSLRAQRMTEAYRSGEQRAYFGLVPESISHEGYFAHPVHAFWDGFWTLRGLKDAAFLAQQVPNDKDAVGLAGLRDDFARDLYAAVRATMERSKVEFLPASVELADFDPNSVAMFIGAIGEQAHLPQAALNKTFEDWYSYFQKRRSGAITWETYTPYEVRLVEAFVRLGQRERATELLTSLMADQRPAAWNQWSEVVWRNPKAPKFVGDAPHTWIGAEFIRSLRTMFAYERESDDALVLGAGVPIDWIEQDAGMSIQAMPTWYGPLSYSLKSDGPDTWHMQISAGLTMPAGGLIVQLPHGPERFAMEIDGTGSRKLADFQFAVTELPADLRIRFRRGKP